MCLRGGGELGKCKEDTISTSGFSLFMQRWWHQIGLCIEGSCLDIYPQNQNLPDVI